MASQQIQVLEESLHDGVEAVLLAKLGGQALAEVTGKHSGRVEILKDAQGRFHAIGGASNHLADAL